MEIIDMLEDSNIDHTAAFLWKTAHSLSSTCPAASRYYMTTLKQHIGIQKLNQIFAASNKYCLHCGSLFKHFNHKIRIQPIPPPNCHIKKLIKLEKGQPWKLNNRQKKKLKKYRESTNKIIYTCNVCKKTTKIPGLKKYRPREQDILINTPTPKLKLKKGDLNAGLFIRTPREKEIKNKSIEDIADNDSPSQTSSTSELTINSSNLQITEKNPFATKIMKKNMTPQVLSSNKKKRKKGLLAQILTQEQEVKRQKKNLSSFLTL